MTETVDTANRGDVQPAGHAEANGPSPESSDAGRNFAQAMQQQSGADRGPAGGETGSDATGQSSADQTVTIDWDGVPRTMKLSELAEAAKDRESALAAKKAAQQMLKDAAGVESMLERLKELPPDVNEAILQALRTGQLPAARNGDAKQSQRSELEDDVFGDGDDAQAVHDPQVYNALRFLLEREQTRDKTQAEQTLGNRVDRVMGEFESAFPKGHPIGKWAKDQLMMQLGQNPGASPEEITKAVAAQAAKAHELLQHERRGSRAGPVEQFQFQPNPQEAPALPQGEIPDLQRGGVRRLLEARYRNGGV